MHQTLIPLHIPPAPGRQVCYWPDYNEAAAMQPHNAQRPCAATIAYVHDDGRLNLSVLDQTGVISARRNVLLVQAGDAQNPQGAWCCWPDHVVLEAYRSRGPAVAFTAEPLATPGAFTDAEQPGE